MSRPTAPSAVETTDRIRVGIAELATSSEPTAVLEAAALGSCICVGVQDPGRQVAGMLHLLLPSQRFAPRRGPANPAMCADTGIHALFHQLYELGCAKSDLVVKLAGGAHPLDQSDAENMGRRNYLAVRQILWRNGVLIAAESVGGKLYRSVRLSVGTGEFLVTTRGESFHI